MTTQKKPSSSKTIYQLKITLKNIKPPIWRRFQVLSSTTLEQLHEIIQSVMDWGNCHLHQFVISGVEYGKPEPAFDFHVHDEKKIKLSQVVTGEKFKFHYVYDFGDDWEHEIILEKILPSESEVIYPICVKGKRACPPENCGGPWGYQDFLAAIQDSSHPEHENTLEWLIYDFDPEYFDLDDINERLEFCR